MRKVSEATAPRPLHQALDLGRTLVWGALVGACLGPNAYVTDQAGPWPDPQQWKVGLLLGVVLGAGTWALSRGLRKKPRWVVRLAFVGGVLAFTVAKENRRYALARDYQRRILQPLPIGATEAEIVARLGPAEKVIQTSDADSQWKNRGCDPTRTGKVLEYGPPDTGGRTRSLYLDSEGRYYCEATGSLYF